MSLLWRMKQPENYVRSELRLWYNNCADSKGSPEIPGNCGRDTHDTDKRDTKIFLSIKTDDQQ